MTQRSLLAVACAAVLAAPSAIAAEDAGYALERWRPALSSDGLIDVEWGGVGRHLDFDIGVAAGYQQNPLVLYQNGARVEPLLAHRAGGSVMGALSLFDWIQLGVELPFVAYQQRNATRLPDLLGPAASLAPAGIGDLRVMPKVRLLRAADQLIDFAVVPGVYVPTAYPGASYLGDGEFGFAPEGILSVPIGVFRAALNGGYRFRGPHTVGATERGSEIFYRGGVGIDFTRVDVPFELDVTVAGATLGSAPFGPELTQSPLEGQLGLQIPLGAIELGAYAGSGILGGVGVPVFRGGVTLRYAGRTRDGDGDGIEDDADACDEAPEDIDGFEDADGCPDPDNDGDSVLDRADKCGDVAEDIDGYQDADGCPDLDDDGDGIADEKDACPRKPGPAENRGCPTQIPIDGDGDGVPDDVDACPDVAGPAALDGCPDQDGDGIPDAGDACPTVPETMNGDRDDDGCPEEPGPQVTVTAERIEISDKIYFAFNKATIDPRSFALLDKVAQTMVAHPEIQKVRVDGHTDSIGDDASNLQLSSARARAVVKYLVDHGVSAQVLEAKGFGETKPVAANTTKEGREKNRRVEFIIVQSAGHGGNE